MHFAPYTPNQLLDILNTRLSNLGEQRNAFLPKPTLLLLSKKVASMTGDVRALFEVLRGAIDLAVLGSNPLDTSASISVTPAHILAALKAYTPASTSGKSSSTGANSEMVVKVKGLGLQARLVLLSILLAGKRVEAGLSLSAASSITSSPLKRRASTSNALSANTTGIDSSLLYSFYNLVLSRADSDCFRAVSRSEFGDLCGVLETVGLVNLSSSSSPVSMTSPSKGRRAFGRSASFGGLGGKAAAGGSADVSLVEGARVEELLRGLGVNVAVEEASVEEEEVRGIWERESKRMAREVSSSANLKSPSKREMVGFDDAMED